MLQEVVFERIELHAMQGQGQVLILAELQKRSKLFEKMF